MGSWWISFSSTRTKILMVLQLQIWRCVVLYQDVAKGPRILVIFLLSLLSIISLGMPSSLRTFCTYTCSQSKRVRCNDVSRSWRWRLDLRNGAHSILNSCQHNTRIVDCSPTCSPSTTYPEGSWSATWISLLKGYHYVCRIFSIDHHF